MLDRPGEERLPDEMVPLLDDATSVRIVTLGGRRFRHETQGVGD